MTTYVIDTNVLVKKAIPEDGSDIAAGILDLHTRGVINLIAPDYILTECANVIWKYARRRDMSDADLSGTLQVLRNQGITLTPQGDLLEEALLFAAATGIAVYDALFCVLARREDAELITADLPLINRLAGNGLRACALHDWTPPTPE